MNNPYEDQLDKIYDENPEQKVTITRADAPDLEGKISEVAEDGVTVVSPHENHDEAGRFTFVAYSDIRGVGYVDWHLGG